MSDLTIDRGNDRTLTIPVGTSLEGTELHFAISRRRGGSVLADIVASGDADGIATIDLPGYTTVDLPAAVLAWDLEGIESELRHTLARGRLYVRDVVVVNPIEGS